MNHSEILIFRKLLQAADADTIDGISDTSLSPTAAVRKPFNLTTATTSPFDSSMALTILVLVTALFFMGFFSVYIRRFAAAASTSTHNPTPSTPGGPSNYRKHSSGLDPTAINSLPLVDYGRAAKHRMIDDCPICLSEFQERECVKLIPYCGHVFHPKCVDTWLLSHVTCPLCRSAQLFKRAGEEVCLDVAARDKSEICTYEGSTVGDSDTLEDWGLGGMRNADHSVMQRSTGF